MDAPPERRNFDGRFASLATPAARAARMRQGAGAQSEARAVGATKSLHRGIEALAARETTRGCLMTDLLEVLRNEGDPGENQCPGILP
jgi:hypothetical protein